MDDLPPLIKIKSTGRLVYIVEWIRTDSAWWALTKIGEVNPEANDYRDAFIDILTCYHQDAIEKDPGVNYNGIPRSDARTKTSQTGDL